jgi:hypothetical protein
MPTLRQSEELGTNRPQDVIESLKNRWHSQPNLSTTSGVGVDAEWTLSRRNPSLKKACDTQR